MDTKFLGSYTFLVKNNDILIAGELRKEGSDNVETVAIKVLKDSASMKAEEDFMREVDVMSAFRHENILSLIGVVLRGKFICSILPYNLSMFYDNIQGN